MSVCASVCVRMNVCASECVCKCVCVSVWASRSKLPTKRTEFGMWSPCNQVSIINHLYVCINYVVFVIATPTGSCFGGRKLIKRSVRPKFGMWSPSI